MRSYTGVGLAVPLAFGFGLSTLSHAATEPGTYDIPATVESGSSAMGDLPEALPEDGELPPPRRKAPPSLKAESPARNATATDAYPATESEPVPTVNDPAVDSAATMDPEAPVEIPGEATEDTITLDEEPPPPTDEESYVEGTPPVAEEPESEAPAPRSAGTSRKRIWEQSKPYYDEKPAYAFQFVGSPQALGTRFEFDGDTSGAQFNVRGFTLSFELQPKFLQALGVVSFGPSFSFYPFSITDPDLDVEDATDGPMSVHAFGGAVKYQPYFFRGQALVPFVGYEFQAVRYKFNAEDGSGSTTVSGPVFGAMLQLQWMEPSAAFDAYREFGLKRSYLVVEAKQLTSSEGLLDTIGNSYWFGLRIEL